MSSYKLKEVVEYSKKRISYRDLSVETYITTDNLLPNKQGVTQIGRLPASIINTPKYEPGNILISNIRPYLKKILYAKTEGGASTDVLTFTVKDGFDSKFVYYNLFQDIFFEHMMAGSKGTKMPRGDKTRILDFEIPKFDYFTQQRIAAVLSALDDKIELNNKINAELEQMAKALYDYWFVQFDFPNAKGKPYKSSGGKMVYNEILKKEIPDGWEATRLGKILKTFLGGTPSTANDHFWAGDIPWMNSGEVGNFPLLSTEKSISEDAIKSSSTKLMKKGSVILSITRHLRVNIMAIDACINQSIAGIEESEEFKYPYIYFAVLNDIDRLMTLRTGAQQPHINKEIVDDSPFLLPSRSILKQYYAKAVPIFEKIINNAKQNQELARLRDWLLPVLMNGQVTAGSDYKSDIDALTIAEALQTTYGATTRLNVPATKKGFTKQVLAGKIVSIFKGDPNFTDIKFQKIQFLAEHIIEADLNLNYYYQAAGPYDNKFMHTIYNDFKEQKWFDRKNKKFIPLEKEAKIEEYYQSYFAPVQELLNKLFNLLLNATEAEAEIIATLYAIWNNRIIKDNSFSDKELIHDFYNWSERKLQYSESQVQEGLQWLRHNELEPKGFGKLIKKAKNKK